MSVALAEFQRVCGCVGALGTEKESKKVKMSDTPEPSNSAFSANDCPPLAKCTRERPMMPMFTIHREVSVVLLPHPRTI